MCCLNLQLWSRPFFLLSLFQKFIFPGSNRNLRKWKRREAVMNGWNRSLGTRVDSLIRREKCGLMWIPHCGTIENQKILRIRLYLKKKMCTRLLYFSPRNLIATRWCEITEQLISLLEKLILFSFFQTRCFVSYLMWWLWFVWSDSRYETSFYSQRSSRVVPLVYCRNRHYHTNMFSYSYRNGNYDCEATNACPR